jgi:hypothetical protein
MAPGKLHRRKTPQLYGRPSSERGAVRHNIRQAKLRKTSAKHQTKDQQKRPARKTNHKPRLQIGNEDDEPGGLARQHPGHRQGTEENCRLTSRVPHPNVALSATLGRVSRAISSKVVLLCRRRGASIGKFVPTPWGPSCDPGNQFRRLLPAENRGFSNCSTPRPSTVITLEKRRPDDRLSSPSLQR